jgi:hypothetical protein
MTAASLASTGASVYAIKGESTRFTIATCAQLLICIQTSSSTTVLDVVATS